MQFMAHAVAEVKNECDPAWALLGEQLEAEADVCICLSFPRSSLAKTETL